MKTDLRPLNKKPCKSCGWKYGSRINMAAALVCNNRHNPPHRLAVSPLTPSDWRIMHNYDGGNTKQTCSKCKRTLKCKSQDMWEDNKPVCPIRTPIGTLGDIMRKDWRGSPSEAYRTVYFFPYYAQEVGLKHELKELVESLSAN